MKEKFVSLEGIAHDQCLEVRQEDWRRLMDLGRWHGWHLPDERLWSHLYAPIGAPEPLPAREARHLADALEGALVSECSHNQIARDPRTPAALLSWCTSPGGKQCIQNVVALLRQGSLNVSSEMVL